MAYVAPYIDGAGLHIPSYADIMDYLKAQAQGIFGSDIYLENDDLDYEFLSVCIALRMTDTLQALQQVYNNRSPATAIGAALDSIIKLNGIIRLPASYSSAEVTLTGTAGTVINTGVVMDTSGNKWSLPSTVIIGVGGTVTCSAVCQTLGAIQASANTITRIMTPTSGWTSVNNAAAAVIGQPVEADSELRARQAVSVALPSITMLDGTIAAIAAVLGVSRYKVYENPTNSTTFGVPGVPYESAPVHSITAIVEGGADADIAQVIYDNRGLGCYMAGDQVVTITDAYGINTDVRFYRPSYVDIYVTVDITRLSGYTTSVGAAIQAALVNYLNNLQIGETLNYSALWGVVLSVMPSLSLPIFSITALKVGTTASPSGTSDVPIDFDETTQSVLAKIVVNET